MKLFDILLEAEAPGTKRETISVKADPNENTNYTDDVPDDGEDTNDDSDDTSQTSTDVNETEQSDDNQDDGADNTDDNTEEDTGETEEVDADDSTDYTEGIDDGETSGDDTSEDNDSSYDDSSSDNEPTEDPAELKKKKSLLDDLILLYKDICTNVDKFENLTDIETKQRLIIIRVKKNFTKISESLYTYITSVFSKDTYVHGLLMYNYYIEMYKINIEMLSKISTFGSNA